MSHAAVASPILSPSEAAFLRPQGFSPRDTVMTAGFEPLLGGEKVQTDPLAATLLALVLLANEKAGVLRFEHRQKKVFFGLFKRTVLVAVPVAGASAAWPEGSLEAAVAREMAKGEAEVNWLVHNVLEEDASSPVLHALGLITRGLHGRALLEMKETKRLKVFTSSSYVPVDGLAAAVETRGVADEEALLAAAAARPELWKSIQQAVGSGLTLRQEHDSNSDYMD